MFSKKKQNKNENRKQNKKQFNLATIDFKKQLQKNFPYIFVFWISNRLGEYFKLSYQTDIFLKGSLPKSAKPFRESITFKKISV